MTRREQLYPELKRLREVEGLQWREIGERLGISRQTACDYYSDPDGSKHRERNLPWRAKDFSQCPECGGRMSAARFGGERCRECHVRREARAFEARLEDVAEMYREGKTLREIADALGYGPNSFAPEVTQARQRGLIGYRNRGYGRPS
jgi:hypothetical protein